MANYSERLLRIVNEVKAEMAFTRENLAEIEAIAEALRWRPVAEGMPERGLPVELASHNLGCGWLNQHYGPGDTVPDYWCIAKVDSYPITYWRPMDELPKSD